LDIWRTGRIEPFSVQVSAEEAADLTEVFQILKSQLEAQPQVELAAGS
jgi:hypothetical protein